MGRRTVGDACGGRPDRADALCSAVLGDGVAGDAVDPGGTLQGRRARVWGSSQAVLWLRAMTGGAGTPAAQRGDAGAPEPTRSILPPPLRGTVSSRPPVLSLASSTVTE